MKKKIVDIISAILVTLMLVVFKYFNGFSDTVCLIAGLVIVELWILNGKK